MLSGLCLGHKTLMLVRRMQRSGTTKRETERGIDYFYDIFIFTQYQGYL
jgi:hypothetical protein